jgi:siderophore synthetase component
LIEQSGLAPEAWLECYLDRTLLPILKLFSNTGISLEAHVQNNQASFQIMTPIHEYLYQHGNSVSLHEQSWHYLLINPFQVQLFALMDSVTTMPDSPMSKLSQVIEQSGLAPEAWLECYLDRTLYNVRSK